MKNELRKLWKFLWSWKNIRRLLKNSFWNAIIMSIGIGLSFLPLDETRFALAMVLGAILITLLVNRLRELFHF